MIEEPYVQVAFNEDTVQWDIKYLADDDDLFDIFSVILTHEPFRAAILSLILAESITNKTNVN